MPRAPKNAFRMAVNFKSHSYSVENLRGIDLTPEDVLKACEDFAARIRRSIKREREKEESDALVEALNAPIVKTV